MTVIVSATPASFGPSVDFSLLGVSVTHRFNNPMIWVPTPIENSTAIIGDNAIGVNIGFLADVYTLSFTLTDGFGINYSTGTKNYEKIVMMSREIAPKVLIIDGYSMHVHLESFNVTFVGGGKDLALNCTLNLHACKNIIME